MRTHFLYLLIGLFFICTSHQILAQNAKKPTERGYTQPQTSTTQQSSSKKNTTNYATKAEKLAADGIAVPRSKKEKPSSKKGSASADKTISGTKSSSPDKRCGTTEHVANRVRSAEEQQRIEELRESVSKNAIPCDGSNSIVIPIAVHYSTDFNCDDTQCLIDAAVNNIATMNEDFAAVNADLAFYTALNAVCPAAFPLDAVSDETCMQFCLATQNHPPAEGIEDGEPAITIGQYTWTGGPDAPNWAGYMNIFVDANTGNLGIAAAPGLGNGDGVQVDAGTWGGRGFASCASGTALNTLVGQFDLGRTLTHELGHYFDLHHVFFQGGVCNNNCDDCDATTFSGQVNVVNDTPPEASAFFGCFTATSCADVPPSGCGPGSSLTNFMNFTDDACMVNFSQDQAAVMNGWANGLSFVSDATVCAPPMSLTSLAACQLTAAFNPPDGTEIVVCTDNGTTIQFEDLSDNGPVAWDWTFTVTSGDIVLSAPGSTMQNPAPMVTAGTMGTLQVDLTVTDAGGSMESTTQTYTVTLVSGDDCPNECDYTLELTDTFGDGWNGATLDITSNGVPIAGSPFGPTFAAGASEINTITLTDSETISFNQTNGGFPNEEGFIITDPFGNVIFDTSAGNVGAGEVFSFTAYCSPPVCDDGMQNGEEGGVDCGGTSPCPDCCSNGVQDDQEGGVDCGGASPCADCCGNGVQDDQETGVDCGGPICAVCPSCPVDFEEIFVETFDACMMPAGWTVTSTDGGEADITFTGGATGVPGGGIPSTDFSGCIAIISDDANDAIGIGCVITPIIDLDAFINTSLVFDWQNNDFAGTGDFTVEVFDGTMWVQVFIEEEDNSGSNQTVALDAFINPNFQIRFCYDDEGGFAWGAGFDNVSICGEFNDECPTEITPNDISGDYCDGTDAIATVNFNPNATYTWASDNPNVVIADPAAGSTSVEFAAPTQCAVETANISLVVVCDLDGVELFNGLVSTVNVYPVAPADLEALLTFNEGTCMDPVTVSAGCESFVTLVPDAANPTFPVNIGDVGTASYTATYASPANCCPDVSGATTDLVADGSFEAGIGGGAWTEASVNFGSPICDLGSCGTGTGTGPSDGNFWVWLGGIAASEVGSVCQSVTVPTGLASLTLSFDLETIICDSPSDFMEVTIDGTQVFFVDGSSPGCGVLGYAPQTIDLLAAGIADGATYTLCFESEIFAANGTGTNFFVDNVQLIAEQPPMEDPCIVEVSGDYSCADPVMVIGIMDPCNCENGIDLNNSGSNDILNETITVTPGAPPYTITAYSGGLVDMAGNPLDQAALQTLFDAAVPDADGVVMIEVFIPADGATVFSISVEDSVGATADFTKPEPCDSCAPLEEVPTVGEWGLIILGLMMTIVAIVGIRERRKVYA